MRILLVGHACCPNLGSEPGLTWNWAWYLSQKHQVWLMVHQQWRPEIEWFLSQNPNPNLHVEWAAIPRWRDPWRPDASDGGKASYRLQLHYLLWQREAFRLARSLHGRVHFDVCHYVSWGTINAAPLLWKLPVPFFWGPLGGAQTAPLAFRKYLGEGWKKEALRTCRVSLRQIMPSLKRAAKRSALVLATNCETKALLEGVGARNLSLFLDNGLPEDFVAKGVPPRAARQTFRMHWSGRLESRKALPLALEALGASPARDVQLEISGDGPERGHCMELAESLGLAGRVSFLGRIPRDALLERFRQADAFLWTSLQDSFGSVLLEAMGQGLPVIALDHQGVRAFVPAAASWKVPVTSPDQTVLALADAIACSADDTHDRMSRARAALAFAESQTWPRRVARMEELYEQYRHPVSHDTNSR